MLKDTKIMGPRKITSFDGIPVYSGSGFEGFHCIYFLFASRIRSNPHRNNNTFLLTTHTINLFQWLYHHWTHERILFAH